MVYDFSRCLEGLPPFKKRPSTAVQAGKVISCCESIRTHLDATVLVVMEQRQLIRHQVSASFTFVSKQGIVGEEMLSQLLISSRAHNTSSPITFKHVIINFEGMMRRITIQHEPEDCPKETAEDEPTHLYSLNLRQAPADIKESKPSRPGFLSPSAYFGQCDLTFAPGVAKALMFKVTPRDSGDVEAVGVSLTLQEKDFDFEVVVADPELLRQEFLWYKSITGPLKKKLSSESNNLFKIVPKPPKMRIEFPAIKTSYFTNEQVVIDIHISNRESEDADVVVEVALLGNSKIFPDLSWSSEEPLSDNIVQDIIDEGSNHYNGKLSSVSIGKLLTAETRKNKVSMQVGAEPVEYVLKVRVLYRLLSDPDTPIAKTVEIDLIVISPFEANYSFIPKINRDPWPNYFSMGENIDEGSEYTQEGKTVANGLCQTWAMTAKIGSFGTEPMVIEGVGLQLLHGLDDVSCTIFSDPAAVQGEAVIKPDDILKRKFDLELQKHSLEDGKATALHLQLEIKWRRESPHALSTTTYLTIPEILVPFGEPRVLAAVRQEQRKTGIIHLEYIIENPSMYVLEFNLTMETSEEFAFSGVKTTSLQLIPLSRHTVWYNLLPLVTGTWISPQFRVVDLHFNKTLKIHATEGIKSDVRGILIWVDEGYGG